MAPDSTYDAGLEEQEDDIVHSVHEEVAQDPLVVNERVLKSDDTKAQVKVSLGWKTSWRSQIAEIQIGQRYGISSKGLRIHLLAV